MHLQLLCRNSTGKQASSQRSAGVTSFTSLPDLTMTSSRTEAPKLSHVSVPQLITVHLDSEVLMSSTLTCYLVRSRAGPTPSTSVTYKKKSCRLTKVDCCRSKWSISLSAHPRDWRLSYILLVPLVGLPVLSETS
uniref:Uncharacterized protein n=1 Tax=Steinernema glaseri TaxID=37863 RepID=A0A1I8AXD5_9BILA